MRWKPKCGRTDSRTDGRTDGRTDMVIPDYPPPNFVAGGIISVCSLKREVKVKVTKFCATLEELINVYKLTKFGSCIIN